MNKSILQRSGLTAKRSNRRLFAGLTAIAVIALCAISCNPEAKWETNDVEINMSVSTVSAGFIECSFSTNKEAYYLVAIEPVRDGYNPMEHQKQFMMLALDSANVAYLKWRNELLQKGEFNVAPFASHALQYGYIDYFFTGLLPNSTYWVYAFVVNPETLKPVGKLYLQTITTTNESVMNIHFDYRVKGRWDYIYPVDSLNNIYGRFPYLATTCDSLTVVEEMAEMEADSAAVTLFAFWALERFLYPDSAEVFYGVRAVENDGWQSAEYFEEGHTYYTALCGYDGSFKQLTVYRFTWTGDSCNLYFRDTDPANIMLRFRQPGE